MVVFLVKSAGQQDPHWQLRIVHPLLCVPSLQAAPWDSAVPIPEVSGVTQSGLPGKCPTRLGNPYSLGLTFPWREVAGQGASLGRVTQVKKLFLSSSQSVPTLLGVFLHWPWNLSDSGLPQNISCQWVLAKLRVSARDEVGQKLPILPSYRSLPVVISMLDCFMFGLWKTLGLSPLAFWHVLNIVQHCCLFWY
jgi:hypothetical protein